MRQKGASQECDKNVHLEDRYLIIVYGIHFRQLSLLFLFNIYQNNWV